MPRAATSLAVVGDLQAPLFVERLFREDNGPEADALVCQLGGESPLATVLLGDLVNSGGSEDAWERFDGFASRIGGVLFPVRGNHDYAGGAAGARRAWLRRFPWFDGQPWYSVAWQRVGLVFLDSNLDRLDPAVLSAEKQWYEEKLGALQADREIEGIVVFLHNAPFTVNPNAQQRLESLRETFVSPLCRHDKALAMITGHAHGYERYSRPCGDRAIEFVVSGGGGGPRPRLARPLYEDACFASGCCDTNVRPLHYLRIEQQSWGLEITAQALRTGAQPGVLDIVRVPFLGHAMPAPPESKVCDRRRGGHAS
jgi:hypothetical protein